jgi:hypothetical protein
VFRKKKVTIKIYFKYIAVLLTKNIPFI